MKLFAYPGYEFITKELAKITGASYGDVLFRHFPDGESLVQLKESVEGEEVYLVGSLDCPDSKVMSMLFFAYNAKELGAKSVGLIAPYLGYMRQDKRFHEGEAVTSRHFAHVLSGAFDRLITIDPHLHRHHSLDDIYTIPSCVLHASDLIVEWVKGRVETPLFIGPDSESEQWVSQVAKQAGAPFIVLDKERSGDYQVAVSSPKVDAYRNTHTPVLVDDIISTARTMIETVKHLELLGARPAVCIGVHAVFADQAYKALQKEHVHQVVSCNTIAHHSNAIDVSSLIASAL